MSRKKITELVELGEFSSEDVFAAVDVENSQTKKIKAFNLKKVPILDASYINIANNSVFVEGPALAITNDGIAVILGNGGVASGASHDWERILTSTSGDFIAQIQLEEAGSVTLGTGTMALSNGELVVGDGQSPADTLVPVGTQVKRINLNSYYSNYESLITGFANVSGSLLSGTSLVSPNTGAGFNDFYSNPSFTFPILGSVSGRSLQIEIPSFEGDSYEIWFSTDSGSSAEIFTIASNIPGYQSFESFSVGEVDQNLKANFSLSENVLFFNRAQIVESNQLKLTGAGNSNKYRASKLVEKDTRDIAESEKTFEKLKFSFEISDSALNPSSDFRSTGDFYVWMVGKPSYKVETSQGVIWGFLGFSTEKINTFGTGTYIPSGEHNGKTLYSNNHAGGSGAMLHTGNGVYSIRDLANGTGSPMNVTFESFLETTIATENGRTDNLINTYPATPPFGFGLAMKSTNHPRFIDVSYF